MSGLSELKHNGLGEFLRLVECRECGSFQRLGPAVEGDVAACSRCHAVLRRAHGNSASLACACAAAVLFTFALAFPLMSLHAAGRFTTGTIFAGPAALSRFGYEEVAWLVLLTLIAAPALKLVILIAALSGERSLHPPRWLPWLYGWLERLSPWAMVEVFLLGVFVAYTRLRVIASVEIGPSLIALGGVMLTMVAADASLDRNAVWETFRRHGLNRRWSGRSHGKIVGCHVCDLVSRTPEGARCSRCRHPIRRRKRDSVARAWAFMLAAAMLYIPANTLPVMTVKRLGHGGPHTILSGVVELFEDRLWPLAILVLLASFVVPVAKLVALAVMLISTHRRLAVHLVARTRIFRVVAAIGRWSMIDIFALTVLVALVHLGFLATVVPGDGALAFAGVVVLTMFATESFDTRLMWDAATVSGPRFLPSAVHSPGMVP